MAEYKLQGGAFRGLESDLYGALESLLDRYEHTPMSREDPPGSVTIHHSSGGYLTLPDEVLLAAWAGDGGPLDAWAAEQDFPPGLRDKWVAETSSMRRPLAYIGRE